jgi:hypothetical protein
MNRTQYLSDSRAGARGRWDSASLEFASAVGTPRA